jgi:Cytochrome P460
VLTHNPTDGAKQLHVVYTARQNLEYHLKTGRFPDGAVLVKDVFATRTVALTTGTASYAGDLAGRFIVVKDGAGKLGLLRRRRDEANSHGQLQGRLLDVPRAGPGAGPPVSPRLPAPAKTPRAMMHRSLQARWCVSLPRRPPCVVRSSFRGCDLKLGFKVT